MNETVKFILKLVVGGVLIGTGTSLIKHSADNARKIGRA